MKAYNQMLHAFNNIGLKEIGIVIVIVALIAFLSRYFPDE